MQNFHVETFVANTKLISISIALHRQQLIVRGKTARPWFEGIYTSPETEGLQVFARDPA